MTVEAGRAAVRMLGNTALKASVAAIAPSYIGMFAGSRLRRVISPTVFKNVILAILAVIASKHIAASLGWM